MSKEKKASEPKVESIFKNQPSPDITELADGECDVCGRRGRVGCARLFGVQGYLSICRECISDVVERLRVAREEL
jgi:hypothetical protein